MAITFSGVTFSGGYQIDPTFVPNAPTQQQLPDQQQLQ